MVLPKRGGGTPTGGPSRIPRARMVLPRRLPVFNADPAAENSNNGEDAQPEPISPIQPVGPEISDHTIPLNSTAMDIDSVNDMPEVGPGVRTRGKGAKKRFSSPKRRSSSFGNKRKKPGNKVAREIVQYQRGFQLLLPKSTFGRLIRGNAQSRDFRWKKDAVEAVQEAAEDYLIKTFIQAQICAHHARRLTIQPMDLLLAQRLNEV